jgi:hypothetical protein
MREKVYAAIVRVLDRPLLWRHESFPFQSVKVLCRLHAGLGVCNFTTTEGLRAPRHFTRETFTLLLGVQPAHVLKNFADERSDAPQRQAAQVGIRSSQRIWGWLLLLLLLWWWQGHHWRRRSWGWARLLGRGSLSVNPFVLNL